MKTVFMTITIISSLLIGTKLFKYQTELNPNDSSAKIIKRVTTYECEEYYENRSPLEIAKESCKIYMIEDYNMQGLLYKERVWYDLDHPNPPQSTTTYVYDDSGNIIDHTYISITFLKTNRRYNYSYNSEGFETEKNWYENDTLHSRTERTYDENNNCIKISYYDSKNKLTKYSSYNYDQINRKISRTSYNRKNEPGLKAIYKYYGQDKEWNYMQETTSSGYVFKEVDKTDYYANNKVVALYSYKLPDKRYKDVAYYSDGKVRTWNYINSRNNNIQMTYNKEGKVIELKEYKGEEWLNTFTWKHNSNMIVIEESESTSLVNGKPYYKKTTYYRLDSKGNWIEKYIRDSEGKLTELTYREIEYY